MKQICACTDGNTRSLVPLSSSTMASTPDDSRHVPPLLRDLLSLISAMNTLHTVWVSAQQIRPIQEQDEEQDEKVYRNTTAVKPRLGKTSERDDRMRRKQNSVLCIRECLQNWQTDIIVVLMSGVEMR